MKLSDTAEINHGRSVWSSHRVPTLIHATQGNFDPRRENSHLMHDHRVPRGAFCLNMAENNLLLELNGRYIYTRSTFP